MNGQNILCRDEEDIPPYIQLPITTTLMLSTMKKLLLGIAVLSLMASCSGNTRNKAGNINDENMESDITVGQYAAPLDTSVDSNNTKADSTIPESEPQGADSEIKNAEVSLPPFKEFIKHGQDPAYFKKKGFKVSTKKGINERDGDYTTVTGSYSPAPGITCKYVDDSVGGDYMEITITGAPDLLDKMYAEAKAYMKSQKKDFPNYQARKKGNTIECILDPYDY